jgi:hypothetical protein
MSFNVKPADKTPPEEGKIYLFDANVWKFILTTPTHLKPYEASYVTFFDAVVNLATNPKCKNQPRIYLNGLIYSEVYNAFVRSRWDAFKVAIDPNCNSVKEYRNTSDFLSSLKSIQADFQAYRSALLIESDLIHGPERILDTMPTFSDYNDYYYFKIATSRGYSIVTNDADFKFQHVEIITMNGKLLTLK